MSISQKLFEEAQKYIPGGVNSPEIVPGGPVFDKLKGPRRSPFLRGPGTAPSTRTREEALPRVVAAFEGELTPVD